MTDRILPPEEWHKLAGTELGPALAALPPERTAILVVEDDAGQIVGCWALVLWYHAEGVWIAPAHRGKTSVARRLWRGMRALAQGVRTPTVITGAADPAMHALLRKRATALPQEYVVCLQP